MRIKKPSPMRGRWHGEAVTDEVGHFHLCGAVHLISRLRLTASPHRGSLWPAAAGRQSLSQPRVYLKTVNAPGQRAFSRCAASFFLEIRQYSCEKMSCSAQKFLAAGHIGSFQIHPRIFAKNRRCRPDLLVCTFLRGSYLYLLCTL